ncbi:MAG TPA: methyltransferase domain-containing protein [Sorangium sp.]|nr:methyltransferase domain-containing protein [Sorangium sp.]
MTPAATPDWPIDVVRDRLIGDWWLYQRRGGHRTSTDDFLTAWFATTHASRPVHRYLDLGCGVGSVLLMTAHAVRPQQSLGIEAQLQSVTLAQRSVSELPDEAPTIIVEHGDIRQPTVAAGTFDLVTGSPPYFPLNTGVLPTDAQRRACRFELRGGVEDYCRAAAHAMSPEGTFVLVFQTLFDPRVQAAAQAVALTLVARADVRMRNDHTQPLLTVYVFRKHPPRGPLGSQPSIDARKLCVRRSDGEWTREYCAARAVMGYR